MIGRETAIEIDRERDKESERKRVRLADKVIIIQLKLYLKMLIKQLSFK